VGCLGSLRFRHDVWPQPLVRQRVVDEPNLPPKLLEADFDTMISIASRNWTSFLADDVGMSSPEHIDVLVRSFKATWAFYFRPDRNTAVLESLARPALAQFLVDKTREGMTDEPSLAAAGLEFLFSLEDDPLEDDVDELAGVPEFTWNVLYLKNAGARFAPVGRVRLIF
jgi:hypothetical protein